jgi:uncharacterized membrane protein (DUF441 family)
MSTKPEFLHVNKLWFFLSIAFVVTGLILMYVDTAPYGFGTTGLTIGAIVCTIGFLMPVVAIMGAKKEVAEQA